MKGMRKESQGERGEKREAVRREQGGESQGEDRGQRTEEEPDRELNRRKGMEKESGLKEERIE